MRALWLALPLVALAGCSRETTTAKDTWKPEGPVAARARVDRHEALIGEPIHYTIDVSSEKGLAVTLPDAVAALGSFVVTASHVSGPTLTAEGRELRSRDSVLEIFATGKQTIPAATVEWRDASGKVHATPVPGLAVTIKSVLPATTAAVKLHDVSGPVELPAPPSPRWPWIAALGAAALLAIGSLALWYRRAVAARPRTPPRPAHEVALAELERIRALHLVAHGAVEEHYVLVSSAIRRYVEDRFGLRAPEMTTEEFLEVARNDPTMGGVDRALLEQFMAECDLVKFARHVPAVLEAEAAITTAEAFVRETTPRAAELVPAHAGPGLAASWDHWEERP